MTALVDADIVIKLARLVLMRHTLDLLPAWADTPAILGATRFVARSRVERQASQTSRVVALASLNVFLRRALVVEPTRNELILAGRLEDEAQALDVALDTGESQLVAILCTRGARWMFTGDKRAMAALETLSQTIDELSALTGRVVAFEQLILDLSGIVGLAAVDSHVRNDPATDGAIRIVFRPGRASGEMVEALNSYIRDLRRSCPTVLRA